MRNIRDLFETQRPFPFSARGGSAFGGQGETRRGSPLSAGPADDVCTILEKMAHPVVGCADDDSSERY